jgi:hypothetical protein
LSSGTDVWAPDFGEVYDFGPFKAGSVSFTANGGAGLVNADFVTTTPLSDAAAETAIFWPGMAGPAPSEVTEDSATQANLKVEYNNAVPFVNPGPGSVLLGVLKAQSGQFLTRFDTYIGTDTKPGGLSGKNSASVQVPVVPTPQTVWGGMALLSVMGLVKARRLVGV